MIAPLIEVSKQSKPKPILGSSGSSSGAEKRTNAITAAPAVELWAF
jgi:hypothetical protein